MPPICVYCSYLLLHSCPLSTFCCPVSSVHCPMSAFSYSFTPVHCPHLLQLAEQLRLKTQTSPTIPVLQCPVSTIRCPLSTSCCPMSSVHCPMSAVQCPILHSTLSTSMNPLIQLNSRTIPAILHLLVHLLWSLFQA